MENIENTIDSLIEGDERYLKIKKVVKDKVEDILNNRQDLLLASIVTVLLAIRGEPNKGMLIDYFGDYGYGYDDEDNFNNANNIENSPHPITRYIQTYHKPILEITGMLHNKVLKIIQNQILLPPLSD